MIEPKTTTIDQLAKRWGMEPTQILEAAIGGQIGLYFRLGYCVVADLPKLSPGRFCLRPYQGELRADISTLECILNHGEARNVEEAYLPEGGRVYVELPPKEGPPGVQFTTPLNIKIENLRALMDEVKIHEFKASGADIDSTGVGRSIASTPGADSAGNAPVDGITTAQVAAIFDDLPFTAENWPKRLSDTKWVKPAQVALGAAGGATSLWCPATLARLIHGKGKGAEKLKTLETLNGKFKNNPVLQPWRTDWNEHYEMFNDAAENK